MTSRQNQRIRSIWCGFLRNLIKGGYMRINPPRKDGTTPDDQIDWRYRYSNDYLLKICRTPSIELLFEKQHLKFIGHVTRRPNSHLQKILCSGQPRKGRTSHWTRLAKTAQIEPMQLRRMMFNRLVFNQWIADTYEIIPRNLKS